MDLIESSLSIIVFCLTMFALVWFLRKVTEYKWAKLKKNKFWNDVILPALPIAFGGTAGGLITSYPYPDLFSSTISHIFFGIFCGLLSGLVYRMVKQNIIKKLGKKETPEEPGPYTK